MSTAPKHLRIGSATGAFAIGSVVWFAFVGSTVSTQFAKSMAAPEGPALFLALIAVVPLLVATLVAWIAVNVSQFEGLAWLAAVMALLIAGILGFLWLAPYTLAAA